MRTAEANHSFGAWYIRVVSSQASNNWSVVSIFLVCAADLVVLFIPRLKYIFLIVRFLWPRPSTRSIVFTVIFLAELKTI